MKIQKSFVTLNNIARYLLLTRTQTLSLYFQQRWRPYLTPQQVRHLLPDQNAQVSFQNLREKFSGEETADYIKRFKRLRDGKTNIKANIFRPNIKKYNIYFLNKVTMSYTFSVFGRNRVITVIKKEFFSCIVLIFSIKCLCRDYVLFRISAIM